MQLQKIVCNAMEKTTKARSPPLRVDTPANAGTLNRHKSTITSFQSYIRSTWMRTIVGILMDPPGPGAIQQIHSYVGNTALFLDAQLNCPLLYQSSFVLLEMEALTGAIFLQLKQEKLARNGHLKLLTSMTELQRTTHAKVLMRITAGILIMREHPGVTPQTLRPSGNTAMCPIVEIKLDLKIVFTALEKTTEARSPPLRVDTPANAGTLRYHTTMFMSLKCGKLMPTYSINKTYSTSTQNVCFCSLPKKNLEENFCRNPDGSSRPWCYTTNPSKRWEFCSIPRCSTKPPAFVPEHTCATGDGRSYRGIISVTKSGKTCQSWESQTPHVHFTTPEDFPCKGLRGNYCRNPDSSRGPWCYTSDPQTRWEYCNVSRCEEPEPEAEKCIHCRGQDYRGKLSTTSNGYTCQRWELQTPHNHNYIPSELPGKYLEENYCRNPDTSPRPWCYTTDPSNRWDYCSIHQCMLIFFVATKQDVLTCSTGDGVTYRGTVSVTVSGKTCQKWTSKTPHEHSITNEDYPCGGLEENYCRNPDRRNGPFCHTTDPETRWEYCSVPICKDPSIPAVEDCMHCIGEDYRGKISITESGYTCQRWDSQKPHKHDYIPSTLHGKNLEENYCRNPTRKPRPWCYTTNPSKRWEYCSIPRCTTTPPTIVPELTCTTGDGGSYRGTISVTKTGKTCQKWTSQKPHEHSRTPEKYPCKGLEENYCRNPDNAQAPWCYTTDPETLWEECNVPNCEDPSKTDCMHCTGEDYRGKISTTESGYTCQRWDSQTPHKHEFVLSILPVKHLEENYCRNPNGSPRPWCYTTNPSKSWEYCSIPQCTTTPPTIVPELTCTTGDGGSYRGKISVTKTGKTCQKWTSQTPHEHSRTPEKYPCKGLEENFCRNPDNAKAPWCYTTDPETLWEHCNVPNCEDPSRPDCMHCTGEDYRGKINITKSGYTCQRWDSQTPHSHDFVLSILPGKHLEENYCRNPDGQPRPWCYTINPSKRWEYCSIPQCTTTPPTIVPELTCTTGDGGSYRGKISVTKSGKTCQKWTLQTPHKHSKTPENYPCQGLDENYCRNPDNEKAPWCYTTDPETRWEYCNVHSCGSQPEDCMHCRGDDYRGKISITESGYICQRWDSQIPHKHDFVLSILPGKHLEENYCRNPDGQPRPWCYTTNPSKRWEYCSIPQCTTTPPRTVPELTCITGKGRSYRGKISITKSGKTCQKWTLQTPHNHDRTEENYPCKGLEENYCRNPDNERAPWCYTTDPETRWEYCNVHSCEDPSRPAAEDCMHCTGEDYRGKISITESGYTCQRWDSQTPHKHDFVLSILPGKHLEENYCRNPDGQPRPWCYTTDPSKRWEYCSIPRCSTTPPTIVPELTCTTEAGGSYRGTISVTKTGKTCQKWTSQTPHNHDRTQEKYPCKGLDENYCRNPDNEKAPWCYTTDPETRWEYCNVPSCEDQPQPGLKCGQSAIKPKHCLGMRVVGGCVSKPHSWPWQISLRIGKSHHCGGTLIDSKWVLTAAHCIDWPQTPSVYKIFLGIHTKNAEETTKQERDVSKIVMGPSETDIALLKLKRPAVINDKVSIACLPEKDYIVPDATDCFVTGWGNTRGTGGEGYLKEAGLPVIENTICNSSPFLDGRVKEHEMCAGNIEGGADSCQGDSGGPLVCQAQNKFVLQGVTSWGIDCAKAKKPGVYARVSKFVDWIEQSMKEN
ncbi:apolipoprotein(a)-like isoform X3 [Paramisgurnus dabryanus]|uniref:apolipoprotein(a)-like isoform X3 n=1 Tax=Paramisgurnus dabryanus TaxID=90735 RepID=UPI003CCEFDC8